MARPTSIVRTRSANSGLVLDLLCCRLDRLDVSQVLACLERLYSVCIRDWLQLCVELVDEWRASGDLQTRNDVIRNVLQILDDGADGVAMRSNEDRLAFSEVRHDGALPEGHHPLNDGLEALRLRDLLRLEVFVLALQFRVVLTVVVNVWRREVEAAAP